MDCNEMLAELLVLGDERAAAEAALDDALDALEDESGFWEPETATTGSIMAGAIVACAEVPPLGCLLLAGVAAVGIMGSEGERQEDIHEAAANAHARMDEFALSDLHYGEAYCEYIEECVIGDDVEIPGLVPLDVY